MTREKRGVYVRERTNFGVKRLSSQKGGNWDKKRKTCL